MSALTGLEKTIAAGEIPPLQLWYGEDRYSMTEGLRLLKEKYLSLDPSGSAVEIFSGKDARKLEEIVAAARTSGFFSGRLVIVDALVMGKAGDEGDEGLAQLIAYCQKPNPQNCLVIIAEKINRTRKLYKVIAKEGQILEFSYPQKYQEWQAWVRAEAARLNKKISASAAAFLLDWCGRNIGILSQEIQKCALYIGNRQEISHADIKEVCVARTEASVFTLLDAIAQGRIREALSSLRDVLSHEYYMKVHGMIVRHIRLLLAGCLVRSAAGKAGTETRDSLMQIAGIRSPYEAGKILAQCGLFKPEQLADYLAACLETEVKIKSGGGEAHFLMEIMVVEFCW